MFVVSERMWVINKRPGLYEKWSFFLLAGVNLSAAVRVSELTHVCLCLRRPAVALTPNKGQSQCIRDGSVTCWASMVSHTEHIVLLAPTGTFRTSTPGLFDSDTETETVIQFSLVISEFLTQLLIGAVAHQLQKHVSVSLSPSDWREHRYAALPIVTAVCHNALSHILFPFACDSKDAQKIPCSRSYRWHGHRSHMKLPSFPQRATEPLLGQKCAGWHWRTVPVLDSVASEWVASESWCENAQSLF